MRLHLYTNTYPLSTAFEIKYFYVTT